MPIPKVLRRIDRRILPPVGRALARVTRGARRMRMVLSVAAVASVAIVLVAVYVATRPSIQVDGPSGAIVRVGVEQGGSIPAYVRDSRERLRQVAAAGEVNGKSPKMYALVSLSSYLTPAQLPAVLGDVQVTNAFLRVPLPERQTEIVKVPAYRIPGDVIGAMRNEAHIKDVQASDARVLLDKVTGTSDEDRALRSTYRANADVASAEADAYRSLCACVYAAVVYTTPAALAVLAERTSVRAVDPAPGLQLLDRAVFLPPLPEQHRRAVPPKDSGIDSG